jgi:putative tributyrin esterase
MGGHGALILTLRNPGVFSAVGSMSGVLDITLHPGQWQLERVFGPIGVNSDCWADHSARGLIGRYPERAKGVPLFITVSTEDPFVLRDNRLFRSTMNEAGLPFVYEESPGTHDWVYWRGQLPRHLKWQAEALGAAPPHR